MDKVSKHRSGEVGYGYYFQPALERTRRVSLSTTNPNHLPGMAIFNHPVFSIHCMYRFWVSVVIFFSLVRGASSLVCHMLLTGAKVRLVDCYINPRSNWYFLTPPPPKKKKERKKRKAKEIKRY